MSLVCAVSVPTFIIASCRAKHQRTTVHDIIDEMAFALHSDFVTVNWRSNTLITIKCVDDVPMLPI